MSEREDGSGSSAGESFEEFARALREVIERYPVISRQVQVLVDVPDNGEEGGPVGAELLGSAEAAATRRCNPPCPPRSRCVFNPRALEWTCFP